MEKHHLWTRKKDRETVVNICSECHKAIHGLFPNGMLRDPASGVNSIEGLLGREEFQRALTFIRKLPPESRQRMKKSKLR